MSICKPTFTLVIVTQAITLAIGGQLRAAEDEGTKALLDEVVAGCEANIALIQRGKAKYTTKRWQYSLPATDGGAQTPSHEGEEAAAPGSKQGPFTSEYTVYFNYPQLRFDWRGNGVAAGEPSQFVDDCYILDAQRVITYAMPQFPAGRPSGPHHGTSNPHAHNVLIDPKRDLPRPMMDPRQQLGGFSAAEEIRGLRKHPEFLLTASVEPTGLVRYYAETPGSRGERWVSPKEGYCLVALKSWNPRFSEPVESYQGTLRAAGNGAYVVEHGVEKSSIVPKDAKGPLPHGEQEVTLVSIDLATSPDEKLFTLDGLDLPSGTKIQDRVEGRTYQYAVAAVKEHDIKSVEPSGPMQARPWAIAAYLLAGMALVSIGFISYRFRRRK